MMASEREFVKGVAAALAEVFRMHGDDVAVSDVLKGFNFTTAYLNAAGVDPDDLNEIRKALGEDQ